MIDKFTFYRNYYEILRYLPDKERLKMYDSILNYMFENKEPELKELLKGIWINIKMPLDTNLKNINNGIKGGRPKGNNNPTHNPDNNPKETQKKPKQKANNISYFLFLISNNNYKYIKEDNDIYNIIKEWLEYKEERKEYYKEIGLSKLLKQIENEIDNYGEINIINLIQECMACNYKGIIFDKLKNKKIEQKEPIWFDKEQQEQTGSKEEIEELENLLKGYKED